MTLYGLRYVMPSGKTGEQGYDSMTARECARIALESMGMRIEREWMFSESSDVERFAKNDAVAPDWREEYRRLFGDTLGTL